MMDPAVPDFCGAIQQQQAPEHNQHTTHSQLHPDPWHRHNEYHGKILYVGALYIGMLYIQSLKRSTFPLER